jgi:hypothetical protein
VIRGADKLVATRPSADSVLNTSVAGRNSESNSSGRHSMSNTTDTHLTTQGLTTQGLTT